MPSTLTSGDTGLRCARCAVIGGLRIVIADEITVIGAFLRPNVLPTKGPRRGAAAGRLKRQTGPMTADIHLTMVTMVFDTPDPDGLAGVLSIYVVLTRNDAACRNVDLCTSATVPGRFVIVEKWDDPEAQRSHFDGPTMVTMARACTGLLSGPPAIDLLEAVSAHDLR